jgi:hypothetical protein
MKYTYSGGNQAGEYYDGDYQCTLPSGVAYATPSDQFDKCAGQGASAWNRFKPGKPKVSGAQSIAELREISSLKNIAKRVKAFRDMGDKYLAYEFGWKPFLSDVRSWYNGILSVDRNIAQLRRDNGRWISRGGTLSSGSDSSVSSFTHRQAVGKLTPSYGVRSAYGTDTMTSSERSWFSARFRYYIPGLNNPKWGKAKAIKHLFDLEIGPEQLWQVLPWSWLADWFSNTGDVISNLMSAMDDQLVGKEAYVMRSTSLSARREISFSLYQYTQTPQGSHTSLPKVSVTATVTQSTKSRAVAGPFGFDIGLPDFDTRKTAILSALGISRLRF